MHVHLDPIGGVAGDMFCGALLDSLPHLATGLYRALAAAGIDRMARVTVKPHRDHTLAGTRFVVEPRTGKDLAVLDHDHDSSRRLGHGHADAHRPFREIRALLQDGGLDQAVKERAIDIFSLVAAAEAKVHGSSMEDVVFHEVGAWDSIIDITAAAWLIEAVEASSWSYSALPLGRGRVRTAHGELPVPAPATTLLLEGFELFDDGRTGERVTPTGAAILRHLQPSFAPQRSPMRLSGSGSGFGEKTFEGLSNILRVLLFDARVRESASDSVIVCCFEVDDQTPEDLAVALERMRADEDVFDVTEAPVVGKKGRLASEVRALVRPQGLDAFLARCFSETTTLGVRYQTAYRKLLKRQLSQVEVDGRKLRVKKAWRPDGCSSRKAEMDDLARYGAGRRQREELRRRAEAPSSPPEELAESDD